jgi:hypothetical protein
MIAAPRAAFAVARAVMAPELDLELSDNGNKLPERWN